MKSISGKDVFWSFMDLERAYDTIDRHGMWKMLRVYGVGGKLLKTVQRFHVDSRACVRVGIDVSEWFPLNVSSICWIKTGLCDVSMVV